NRARSLPRQHPRDAERPLLGLDVDGAAMDGAARGGGLRRSRRRDRKSDRLLRGSALRAACHRREAARLGDRRWARHDPDRDRLRVPHIRDAPRTGARNVYAPSARARAEPRLVLAHPRRETACMVAGRRRDYSRGDAGEDLARFAGDVSDGGYDRRLAPASSTTQRTDFEQGHAPPTRFSEGTFRIACSRVMVPAWTWRKVST